uniref:Uncharacterized protein n=1 Tax=Arundo donax TaxID=35708 RepID=A0A0A8YW42_ARUDO
MDWILTRQRVDQQPDHCPCLVAASGT